MSDRVQEIIDTLNLLSLENQGTLFEFVCNTLKAANSAKKTVSVQGLFDRNSKNAWSWSIGAIAVNQLFQKYNGAHSVALTSRPYAQH